MNAFFQHKYDDAMRTSNKLVNMGEYLWARDWTRYAHEIEVYALQYQRNAAYAVKWEKPAPVLKLPLQPTNLTSTYSVVDGVEHENRRQCRNTMKSRNPMFSGVN